MKYKSINQIINQINRFFMFYQVNIQSLFSEDGCVIAKMTAVMIPMKRILHVEAHLDPVQNLNFDALMAVVFLEIRWDDKFHNSIVFFNSSSK